MDRRQYLGAAGTVLAPAALAGCLGSGDGGADDVFVETAVNDLELDVEFAEDSDIREVSLIHEGELAAEATLSAGETRTSIRLVEYSNGEVQGIYPPGEHTLVATDADGGEHEHELTIEPASEIVNVGVLEDYPRRLAFQIENGGTGPDALVDITVTGEEVAQPFDINDGTSKRTLQKPAAADHEAVSHVPLPPGEAIEIVPSEDFLGFPVVTSYEPDADPAYYDSVEELEDEWAGETTDLDVVVQAAVHDLLADVEIRFDGEVSEQPGLSNHYNFSDLEVVDVETSTEAV